MSIYMTLWEMKLDQMDGWVEIIAQAVPSHIGDPEEGYETDPYADFLPPVVDQDVCDYRAVVIVAKGRDKKDGQRYIDPLMVLTEKEFFEISLVEFRARIYEGLDRPPKES